MVAMSEPGNMQRLRTTVRGGVQGVGFRPFVYRLATDLGLNGWVSNSPQGVTIEVEGDTPRLACFLARLASEKPPRAFIHGQEHSFLDPVGYSGFAIRESDRAGEKSALVLADIATCPDCLREIFDPSNRRYLYPFTNCTNCGPRFTIIESLPYDRPNTTMKLFGMCDECLREYQDPGDRRFHAQPNACPRCGPHLELWEKNRNVIARDGLALRMAAEGIRCGQVIAVKGLGGFHLIVDARNEDAVRLLRKRKHREEKPLALMYPSLRAVHLDCIVSGMEERLLRSPEAPIVLMQRRTDRRSGLAPSVAPANPYLGVMLPYTPLHYILLHELDFPVVATSGNYSEEPICIDEQEAADRLADIADAFLIHTRPIVRHVDDSVVRVMAGREMVVRRARGYAPLPVNTRIASDKPLLAVGAHLKNAVALSVGENVFVSQHIGDLETAEAFDAFRRVSGDLQRLYDVHPGAVVCDMHPEYLSSKYSATLGIPVVSVQHHEAHVASCMAENDLDGRVLGVSWDGTGYGPDGTIWGGEFLLADDSGFHRAASLKAFRLPGGDRAIREPRRTALAVLFELFGDALFDREDLHPFVSFPAHELHLLRRMLEKKVNTPVTTSAGRLFDAVSSLVGLRQHVAFEGQAAMELEFAMGDTACEERYEYNIIDREPADGSAYQPSMVFDWSPVILGVIEDIRHSEPVPSIAARFHNALCEGIVAVAGRTGEERVVLSGGCFQNRYLTERTVRRLREEGFRPYWHQRVPPNDGGIALGQISVCRRRETGNGHPEVMAGCESTTHEHHQEEKVG